MPKPPRDRPRVVVLVKPPGAGIDDNTARDTMNTRLERLGWGPATFAAEMTNAPTQEGPVSGWYADFTFTAPEQRQVLLVAEEETLQVVFIDEGVVENPRVTRRDVSALQRRFGARPKDNRRRVVRPDRPRPGPGGRRRRVNNLSGEPETFA